MYDDIELLEFLYQNVKINQETIGQIIKLSNLDIKLNSILKEHLKKYMKIANSIKLMLQRRNKEVKDISIISKMGAYMSVKTNLSRNNNLEDIEAIVVLGSKIGIDEINKRLKEYKIKSRSIINLSERLIMFEKDFIKKIES